MNWVEHLLACYVPIDTPTVKTNWNSKGVRYNASAGGGNGTTVKLCVVTQLFGTDEDMAYDYIGVTQFNTTSMSLSGAQFICAKAITARGPMSELIPIGMSFPDQTIVYSQYYLDISRFALNSTTGASEYDSIHPRYIAYPGDGMLPAGADITQYYVEVERTQNATGVTGPNGEQLYFLETNNRVWGFDPSLSGS
jgi:hypothetical protein